MSQVRFAPAPASYMIRYVGWHIWGWQVTWCSGGDKFQKHGYAFSGDRAMAKGSKLCRKINDPKHKWQEPPHE